MVNKALLSSNSDEWSTPQDLFLELDKEFHFELDPCASLENHKCELFFTKAVDGLCRDWNGLRVFCNPPYSNIKAWVKKCFDEHNKGSVVVLLIPSRTDTSYFHDYILGKAEIRFICGRLHFNGSKNAALFPSLLAIYR